VKVKKISSSILFSSRPDGYMPPDQIEGILLGFFYRASKSRDRRAGATVVGERPKGSMSWDDKTQQWLSDAGEPILGVPEVNKITGLPESASALLPNHRAKTGWDLALAMVIPPEDFIASIIYTDDLPQNLGKPEGQKESVALAYKEKFRKGPMGRPLAHHRCMTCGEEWEGEMIDPPRCRACGERGSTKAGSLVDRVVVDGWSEEEVEAVKTNTRTLKQVVHKLAEKGLFITKPRIDEHATGELGTSHLIHGEDHMTMGFAITPKGLKYAEEFVRRHPKLMEGHTILDAMGNEAAACAPQWLKDETKNKNKAGSVDLGGSGGLLSRVGSWLGLKG